MKKKRRRKFLFWGGSTSRAFPPLSPLPQLQGKGRKDPGSYSLPGLGRSLGATGVCVAHTLVQALVQLLPKSSAQAAVVAGVWPFSRSEGLSLEAVLFQPLTRHSTGLLNVCQMMNE
jgi:hypothetical protein